MKHLSTKQLWVQAVVESLPVLLLLLWVSVKVPLAAAEIFTSCASLIAPRAWSCRVCT